MSTDNIVPGQFRGTPFKEPGALQEELHAVIRTYNGRVPLVMVLGVLRVLEHAILEEQRINLS